MTDTPFNDEDHPTTVAVLRALKAGYGVEDIHVGGIASAEYARKVIARLRRTGDLKHVLDERRKP